MGRIMVQIVVCNILEVLSVVWDPALKTPHVTVTVTATVHCFEHAV